MVYPLYQTVVDNIVKGWDAKYKDVFSVSSEYVPPTACSSTTLWRIVVTHKDTEGREFQQCVGEIFPFTERVLNDIKLTVKSLEEMKEYITVELPKRIELLKVDAMKAAGLCGEDK